LTQFNAFSFGPDSIQLKQWRVTPLFTWRIESHSTSAGLQKAPESCLSQTCVLHKIYMGPIYIINYVVELSNRLRLVLLQTQTKPPKQTIFPFDGNKNLPHSRFLIVMLISRFNSIFLKKKNKKIILFWDS